MSSMESMDEDTPQPLPNTTTVYPASYLDPAPLPLFQAESMSYDDDDDDEDEYESHGSMPPLQSDSHGSMPPLQSDSNPYQQEFADAEDEENEYDDDLIEYIKSSDEGMFIFYRFYIFRFYILYICDFLILI